MGIGTSETLISILSQYATKYKLSEIYKAFKTDEDYVKVAIDASVEKFSIFCALWSNIVEKIIDEKTDLTEYLNDDYMVDQTAKILLAKNKNYLSVNLDPYWCLEGKPNKNKLATQNRSSDNNRRKEELLLLILKAEKACEMHCGNIDSPRKIKRFEYVKNRLMDAFPKVKLEYFDEKKEEFSKIYSRIVVLAKQVRIYPPKFFDRVEQFMLENKEFKCIRVPEISEAEKLGSILTQVGFCKILFTSDSDAIVLGARYFATKTNGTDGEKEYSIFSYEKILSEEGLTPISLLMLGILLGNDFNTKAYGDGYKKVRRMMADPDFCIFKYNADLCGILNPDICIKELGVRNEERELVMKALEVFRN